MPIFDTVPLDYRGLSKLVTEKSNPCLHQWHYGLLNQTHKLSCILVSFRQLYHDIVTLCWSYDMRHTEKWAKCWFAEPCDSLNSVTSAKRDISKAWHQTQTGSKANFQIEDRGKVISHPLSIEIEMITQSTVDDFCSVAAILKHCVFI